MLVSVAIPAYNGASYLREAIDSVLAQTHRELEIVVVDDGSTDDTAAVCASYSPRVRYIYQENDRTNGAGARAAAIQAGTGDWIAILDQDDRWLPEKIERQLSVLQAEPTAALIFTGFRPIDSAGEAAGDPILTATPNGNVFHLLLTANPYCASSALIKRQAIIEFGLPVTRPGPADYELWLHLARHADVAVVSECLTEYRTHDENYSTDMSRLAEGVLEVLDRQRERSHPNCAECRTSLQLGVDHFSALAADAYLNQYHADARAGQIGAAWNSLRRAARLSPRSVWGPRRGLAIVKNGLLGAVVGPRRDR